MSMASRSGPRRLAQARGARGGTFPECRYQPRLQYLVSSMGEIFSMCAPPATSTVPPVSASGNPEVAVAHNTALTGRRDRKEGLSRNADAEQDDLVSSMGRVSMRSAVAGNAALTDGRNRKEGLSRNADAEQDDLVSSLGRVSMRPPLTTPPATIVLPPVSASGNPEVAVANSTALMGRRSRKEGLSRHADAEQDDLISFVGRESMCSGVAGNAALTDGRNMKEGLSRNANAEQDNLVSSLARVSMRPPLATPPAKIVLRPVSASGNLEVAMASNAALTDRRNRKEGLSRHADAEQDDLVSSMRRVSIRPPLATSPATIVVPRISAFVSGKPAVAVAGKAVVIGEAIAKAEHIADNFSSTSEYLKAMQAHVQLEFEASLREAVAAADRTPGGGWMQLSCRPDPRMHDKVSFFVDGTSTGRRVRAQSGDDKGRHNFVTDPWSRHVIQVEGETVPALVVLCTEGYTKHQAFLMIASARGFGRGGVPVRSRGLKTRVRSLGYVGPFLQQYGKAAQLVKGGDNRLLDAIASPGRQTGVRGPGGTFLPADVGALDTSRVPLNPAQRVAVLKLSGGLDIVVGPPGTGKSTTIFHIIDSRVRHGARVLDTSSRNQAVDAVAEKVHTFGVLVLGNESRLGDFAKDFTIDGRMRNDPELVFWRRLKASWAAALRLAEATWRKQYILPTFPGLSRLWSLEDASSAVTGTGKKARKRRKRGRAAALWAFALESVLQANYDRRVKNGSRSQRRMFRRPITLDSFQTLLQAGYNFVTATLDRLELLTRLRILTKTTVFISTIDSSESSLRRLKLDIAQSAKALRLSPNVKRPPLTIDTVILDEAGCVLETAIPVLLSLGTKNLTLVGDHNQLRPFSNVREGKASMNHSRSLMERVINSGMTPQFLNTQYRMHPDICHIVSSTFYDNKLLSAEVLKLTRGSPQPCAWVHVSGGEEKHPDRGFSNPKEVPKVVIQARAAVRRYGTGADIRVITFYNMQKLALERAFKTHRNLKNIRIVSVDSCQGSDADVIIISTVRSGGSCKLSGFMLDRSRVNVAISRAKQECIIVGDKDTLRSRGGAMWRSVVDHYAS